MPWGQRSSGRGSWARPRREGRARPTRDEQEQVYGRHRHRAAVRGCGNCRRPSQLLLAVLSPRNVPAVLGEDAARRGEVFAGQEHPDRSLGAFLVPLRAVASGFPFPPAESLPEGAGTEISACTRSSLLPFCAASKAAPCTGPLVPPRLALAQAGGLLPGPAMSPLVPPDTPAGQGPRWPSSAWFATP